MSEFNTHETVRDLAVAASAVQKIGEHPFAVIPENYEIDDLEKMLPRPLAVRANVTLATVDAFIVYVLEFKDNPTRIFAHPITGKLVAILDYHEPKELTGPNPSWCAHRCLFAPTNTVEWSRWMGSNNIWLKQRDFAEFIENNVDDIKTPNGAEMLEIASSLEAKTAVEFKSGVRLDNGSHRLSFSAETVAKAGDKGTLDIPSVFTLAIAPFVGGEAYPLNARFRHRIEDGKLTLRYQLVNPHKIIESAVARTVERVATATAIKPFIGEAP